MRRALIGLVVLVAAAAMLIVLVSGRGISAARHRPWPMEETVTRTVWRLMVPRHIRDATNPVAATSDTLTEAREHWADHCATCHDNDGSGQTTIGRRVYPPAPDLRLPATQHLTDGELFYAIEQGIPWTAMPGWTTGADDGAEESWTLVRFIRHLPALTQEELNDMERLNPKPPPNLAQEKEIEDFLNGPTPTRSGSR